MESLNIYYRFQGNRFIQDSYGGVKENKINGDISEYNDFNLDDFTSNDLIPINVECSNSSTSKVNNPKDMQTRLDECTNEISRLEEQITAEIFNGNLMEAETLMEQRCALEEEKVILENSIPDLSNNYLVHREKLLTAVNNYKNKDFIVSDLISEVSNDEDILNSKSVNSINEDLIGSVDIDLVGLLD